MTKIPIYIVDAFTPVPFGKDWHNYCIIGQIQVNEVFKHDQQKMTDLIFKMKDLLFKRNDLLFKMTDRNL